MSSFRLFTLRPLGLAAPLLLFSTLACTGTITDGEGTDGPGSGNTPGKKGSVPDNRTGTFTGPIVSEPAATSRFLRLTHQQWENTVRDLLRLTAPLGLSSTFVAEPLRGTFDTNASALAVSADLWRDYQSAAETVAATVAEKPELLTAIVPSAPAEPAARARAFIEDFGRRAYRRPLTDAELGQYVALFNQGSALIGKGDAFVDGVELVLSYFLQSPHLIYRVELGGTPAAGKVRLNSYEVATRLSYGLTNTLPDDALFAAAAADRLQTRDGVIEQAKRLLDSPAAEVMVADFHAQLLSMGDYETVTKDPTQFPLFAQNVGLDLRQEAQSFVKSVVFEQELGLTELLTAPYTFANGRIAELYGQKSAASQPDSFVRLALDPKQRAGLLTQLGFLASHAEGPTPNIIMRGVHVAKRIMCMDLPPPPNNIPALPEIAPNATNRQRVEELTGDVACAKCHVEIINPLGFAFENLDGVGRYRTEENGQPIDASSSYVFDGKKVSFNGAVELIKAMASSMQAHDCFARHWVEYVYGRDVTKSEADQNLVKQGGWLSNSNSSVKNLIVNLVATDAFLTRLP